MSGTQDISGVVIQDILTSIQTSQNSEQDIVAQLDILTNQSNFTMTPEIQAMVDAINGLSSSRISLFQTISDKADVLQAGVSNSRTDLISQMTLLQVVEDQLNQAKKSMANLQNSNDTQLRLVQINTYYGKRYSAQSTLMKLIILICVPLLILLILKKKGLIPELISNYAIGITVAIGAFFVIRAAWDISTRSNMEFDEYNWNYENPTGQVPTVWQYNKANFFNIDNPLKNLMGNLGLCLGSNCCANGMYFDTKNQQCTTNAISGAMPVAKGMESFTSGSSLNGTAIAKFDRDEEKQNGISPYSDVHDYAWVQ
jgi:hypothetical protein